MKMFALAGLALSALAATPAAAVSYDAVADFGSSVFSYGTFNGSTFSAFTLSATGACPYISGATCYYGADAPQLVADAGSFVLAHPGANSNTALLFTAPTTSLYSISGSVNLVDPSATTSNSNGVTLTAYTLNGNFVPLTTITAGNGFSGSNFQVALNAGQTIGLVIGNNGNSDYDSTGITGTITAVPEAATWAMMIGGFGLVGGVLRRRATPALRTA